MRPDPTRPDPLPARAPGHAALPHVTQTPYVREPGYPQRYRDRRFRSGTGPGTHGREIAAIRALLARTAARGGIWLDVPCGAGRLTELLPGRVVRVDQDLEMLRACPGGTARACASAHALPFVDAAFQGALCMRLMHHLPTSAERVAILAELSRVTAGPVLVSFFHSVSLQHARRVVRRRLGKTRSGRVAIRAHRFRGELAAAGLRAVHEIPLRRFVSEQWLVLAAPR